VKILIPTADYPPIAGGIASVALHVSRRMAALGHEVTVVAPHFPGMEAFDRAEPARVIRYGGYGLGWLRLLPLMAAAWPHTRSADLILPINIAYGGALAYFAGRPYLAFAYAYEFLKFRHVPPVAAFYRRVYARARKVIAISAFTRNKLAEFGVPVDHIEIVHPGAPEAHPLPPEYLDGLRHRFVLDSNGPIILAVGRLVPRKGHQTLVRAMPRILERYPNAVLVIAGQGPSIYPITQEAWRHEIRNQVRILEGLSDEDIAGLYQVCDVFALPTREVFSSHHGHVEGFGLVFIEAGAHGKPVVAGRSGGVVDAVRDGETGLLVEPNDPDALADALLSLLDNPDYARRLGENGRRRAETELNWTVFARRLLEIAGTTP